MSTVIEVKNLSKRYRIGLKEKRHDTFASQILATLKAPIDNFRRLRSMSKFGAEDESVFWALRDINFEVKEGEVLGIIGHNGAGKSTLLKILSRITEPTSGEIRIKGRISALLEVGTGFHQDLTGRENVYMNGTILGMTKREIDAKFDEIVDFSGVEKYIDTPVKFYSSGMKVRLGFAVAAHLEPEILIIDEVLAVGDAEFQRKCLGKMQDVSTNLGRTVLFVSHNMEAVLKLCNKGLLLHKGNVIDYGDTQKVINHHLRSEVLLPPTLNLSTIKRPDANLKGYIKYRNVTLLSEASSPWKIPYKTPLRFRFELEVFKDKVSDVELGIAIYTTTDFEIVSPLSTDYGRIPYLEKGIHIIDVSFIDFFLLPNFYKVGFGIRTDQGFEDYLPFCCEFEVLISKESAENNTSKRNGIIIPKIAFQILD